MSEQIEKAFEAAFGRPMDPRSASDAVFRYGWQAALATQPQAPQGAVTPGFRLLPTEPTEAMLLAGGQSIIEGQDSRPSTSWAEEAGMSYKAMISAAPETPEGKK